jgi:hypothetical protein
MSIDLLVSGSACGGIAITAAEGGTNYWARIISARDNGLGYDYKRWSPDYMSASYIKGEVESSNINVPDDFVFYQLRAFDDRGDDLTPEDAAAMRIPALGGPIDITPQLIRRGIGLVLNGVAYADIGERDVLGKWNFEPRAFADMEDLEAMDAYEADWVIQLGAFGRLVFG